MTARSWNSTASRYGFNGQEKDSEIGEGIYTAEFWQYDSRIGRRWNIDPVIDPSESPYACFKNNPIAFNDPAGDCADCPDDPISSKYLGGLGIDMGSFGNGIADGFIGALPDVAGFAWDMLTDEHARADFMTGMQTMLSDPLGTLKAIAGEKYELYSAVLSGEGTAQQQYEVGKEVGNLLFGVATGAAASKLTEVLKVAKFEKQLLKVAEVADNTTGAGKATVRGTKIHSKFEKALPDGKAEVSYKNGDVVTRGNKGSVRADVIYGSQKNPKIAYDLKTGKSGMSNADVTKYNNNLPKGTKVKEISKGSDGKYQIKKK